MTKLSWMVWERNVFLILSNQRGVTTFRAEGAQMGRVGSGTLSGDLH
jgi:hypothetical protein